MAKTNKPQPHPITLVGEFAAGIESGKKPHPDNTNKAVASVASRNTEPMIRAYWTGYLCQCQTDDPTFMYNI